MSFFIGLSKSPAVPAVSRDTSRRPSSLPRSSFFPSRPKLNTLESERLNLSAITRSFPSSSIKARLGQLSLSPPLLSLSFSPPSFSIPTASNGRSKRLISRNRWKLIYPQNQSLHACASMVTAVENHRADGMKKRTRERRRGRKRR